MATQSVNEQTESRPKLTGAFDLVKPGFNLIRNNLSTFLVLGLAPVVLIIISAAIWLYMLLGGFNIPKTEAEFAAFSNTSLGFWIMSVIGVLIVSIISMIFGVAMEYAALQAAKGQRPKLDESLQVGWRYIPRMVVFWLMIVGILIPAYLFFIIPGLVLTILWWPRLTIAPFVIFEEKIGPWQVFKRAGELAKVGMWDVIVVMVLVFIVVSMSSSFLSTTFAIALGESLVVDFILSLAENAVYILVALLPALRYLEIKKFSKT